MDTEIRLHETRAEDGLKREIPRIVVDERLYDPDLDRFFLELPLNGRRSRHSLRASGYDVVVWLRFLDQARRTTVWQVSHDDVLAFHNIRRRGDAAHRISAASWNRSIATLDKLYRWGVERGLIAASPFRHREVRHRRADRAGMMIAERNMAIEPASRRSNVRFISLEQYRAFVDVGLRGRMLDGRERAGARDRNTTRNALFSDLIVSTGLRLEEASALLAYEIPAPVETAGSSRQIPFTLPDLLTKGSRGRTILLPQRIAARIRGYRDIERARAVEKFVERQTWCRIVRPIAVERSETDPHVFTLGDGSRVRMHRFDPGERLRLILIRNGSPVEPAALWVSEVGVPVLPNTWEAAFLRASRRCAASGLDIYVSPHRLRHTFAVHMLAMLIEQRAHSVQLDTGNRDIYRQILSDPLQQVQRLLGHASITTTYIYLDEIAAEADTIDTAVERLLATLTSGAVL